MTFFIVSVAIVVFIVPRITPLIFFSWSRFTDRTARVACPARRIARISRSGRSTRSARSAS